MDYFNNLPSDIQTYIYQIRLANQLQNSWNKYCQPKIIAMELAKIAWNGDYELDVYELDVYNPYTCKIIEYTARTLTGKENAEFWYQWIEFIDFSLQIDEFTGGPGSKYYNRSEIAYNILRDKFIKN